MHGYYLRNRSYMMQKGTLKRKTLCEESDTDDDCSDSDYEPSLEYSDDSYVNNHTDEEDIGDITSEDEDTSDDEISYTDQIDTTKIEKRLKLSTVHGDNSYESSIESASIPSRKQKATKKYQPLMERMSPDEKSYFLSVSEQEREYLMKAYDDLIRHEHDKTPFRFRILTSPMPDATKRLILNKLDMIQTISEDSAEYHKYYTWIQSIGRMPIGKYQTICLEDTTKVSEILHRTNKVLDEVVFGHKEAKDHILRILAQWVSNPSASGHCIGIQGPMGIGKTTLIKDGVSRALGIPFGFIALGGANDASSLEGHSFTYEGSTYGRISEILMKTQVMNPILFFDELDKVSESAKGEEISSILTHITDQTQNQHFTDRYFGEIEIDLSKALMVFSFNDESKINPILKDRLTIIRVKGYTEEEKVSIAKNYMIPILLKQYGLTSNDIQINYDILYDIIRRVPQEEGVRNLRRGLESIISWINMARYIVIAPFTSTVTFPLCINNIHVENFISKNNQESTIFKIK